MAILEQQISRFETEWLAAEARLALEIADFEAAREHLGALARPPRRRRRSAIARVLARWAPRLLTRVYGLRRGRPAAAAAVPPLLP